MVLTRRQAQIIISKSNNISINQQVHMDITVVNYVLSPFEGNINTGDKHAIEIYLQNTKYIDKKSGKLDISI